MKKNSWMIVAALMFAGLSQAQAFDWFGGRLSIGGGYGRAKPKLPYSYQDQYQDGEMWTGNIKYALTNDLAIVASYADLQPYQRGNRRDVYRFRPIVGSLRYNIFRNLPFTPYITAGAGHSYNKHEFETATRDTWNGFTYQGGLGLEFFITEGTSLGAEALYHHFQAEGDTRPYRLISGVGTINIYFGPGPSKRRAEAALAREKEAVEKARADAEAARQQALAAQQQQATSASAASQAQLDAARAQQGQQAAEASAAAANAAAQEAAAKMAAMENKNREAQAELDNIKAMVARKDLNPITFKTGSAELVVTSNATLDKVSEAVKKYPDLKLRIEGHTDNQGSDAFNVRLSQQRADAVKNYIVNQNGVPASQVTAIGIGEANPVADNATPEGRAQNRRVEFITHIQ